MYIMYYYYDIRACGENERENGRGLVDFDNIDVDGRVRTSPAITISTFFFFFFSFHRYLRIPLQLQQCYDVLEKRLAREERKRENLKKNETKQNKHIKIKGNRIADRR